ncbi:hypothetical protein C0966_02400 [Bacillus methanolicus]|uniref:UPF0738 family protein n=1 Tax=Bacillus methanolicus TaxID=1471 RepID=UPI002380AC99|nr:hypothetical protein [Bacillus methanolicus]MDE3838237.1 hypothetical protein [Bacillus methanolicus]
MKHKIHIQSVQIKENQLLLETDLPITNLKAVGRILVDSDNFSFIYLTENKDDYTYIVLSEPCWDQLKESLQSEIPAYLVSRGETLELINFHNELKYLIENIKGNSNYGEDMVEKVENTFKSV